MMSPELFVSSCNYIRWGALLMGFILFLSALFVILRPKGSRLYSDTSKNPRAVNLYLRGRKSQKEHLFWMLVICAIFVWYVGAAISSSYVTDPVVYKGEGCPAESSSAAYFKSYNTTILYPPILFGTALVLAFVGNLRRGKSNEALHLLSYFFLLAGLVSVITLFTYLDICNVAASCS